MLAWSLMYSDTSTRMVGSLFSVRYVASSLTMLIIFSSYVARSKTTLALPLSAGTLSSFSRVFRACFCWQERLGLGSFAVVSALLTPALSCSAVLASRWRAVASVAAMISATGILEGAMAKFIPSDSTSSSMLRDLLLRLTNYLGFAHSVAWRCETVNCQADKFVLLSHLGGKLQLVSTHGSVLTTCLRGIVSAASPRCQSGVQFTLWLSLLRQFFPSVATGWFVQQTNFPSQMLLTLVLKGCSGLFGIFDTSKGRFLYLARFSRCIKQ